jgi:hypothetical protein
MATNYRQADFTKIQVQTTLAETNTGNPIPSTYMLTADGSGGTIWRSLSTIYPYSTFRTVKGNTATTFSADLNYNTLQISTTGVRGTFESYVDSATSTLMMSNAFPPIGVTNVNGFGDITTTTANTLPGGFYMAPVDGNSTIKFIGVGDLKLSTITGSKTTFLYVSSYTAAGYFSISGELLKVKQGVPSTFSTMKGQPSFVSSITSNAGWRLGAQTGTQSGTDLYLSTCVISNVELLYNHVDTENQTTKLFVDYYPGLILGAQTGSGIFEISTFLSNTGYGRLAESVTSGYITSQNAATSNVYMTPVRMAIDPFTSLASIAGQGANQPLLVVHRIVGGSNAYSANYENNQSAQNSLFVTMTNSAPDYMAPP